jgi:hypothetical protein
MYTGITNIELNKDGLGNANLGWVSPSLGLIYC